MTKIIKKRKIDMLHIKMMTILYFSISCFAKATYMSNRKNQALPLE